MNTLLEEFKDVYNPTDDSFKKATYNCLKYLFDNLEATDKEALETKGHYFSEDAGDLFEQEAEPAGQTFLDNAREGANYIITEQEKEIADLKEQLEQRDKEIEELKGKATQKYLSKVVYFQGEAEPITPELIAGLRTRIAELETQLKTKAYTKMPDKKY